MKNKKSLKEIFFAIILLILSNMILSVHEVEAKVNISTKELKPSNANAAKLVVPSETSISHLLKSPTGERDLTGYFTIPDVLTAAQAGLVTAAIIKNPDVFKDMTIGALTTQITQLLKLPGMSPQALIMFMQDPHRIFQEIGFAQGVKALNQYLSQLDHQLITRQELQKLMNNPEEWKEIMLGQIKSPIPQQSTSGSITSIPEMPSSIPVSVPNINDGENQFMSFFTSIKEVLGRVFESIGSFIKDAVTKIKDVFTGLMGEIGISSPSAIPASENPQQNVPVPSSSPSPDNQQPQPPENTADTSEYTGDCLTQEEEKIGGESLFELEPSFYREMSKNGTLVSFTLSREMDPWINAGNVFRFKMLMPPGVKAMTVIVESNDWTIGGLDSPRFGLFETDPGFMEHPPFAKLPNIGAGGLQLIMHRSQIPIEQPTNAYFIGYNPTPQRFAFGTFTVMMAVEHFGLYNAWYKKCIAPTLTSVPLKIED